ncbi:MAG: hypothetical protein KIT84_44035 [Labilithrix sp.]|nr:hypothetical protein [Labilithrix sp.]MCW5818049.1 hypothetical protein [Labilithrix sp.]
MASKTPTPLRLVEILKALPPTELESLVSRLGVRIDPAKRLDPPAQVARALVALPELREPGRLPQASVELLHRVAEARGLLVVASVPPALQPLAERGILFARAIGKNEFELILPAAYLVQLRTWEGEDPRGVRALLAQAPFETVSAIAGHYLGRPATPPIALSLEQAWEVLGDPTKLAQEIEKLSATERRVLEGAEELGGEVDTEELLELEREPLRLRTASGATPSRRGVGFSLERRGLLIPVHPNRHIVPTEVGRIIGAARTAEREARREQVRTFVTEGDHAPRRARFSQDPAVLAMALALAAREPGNEVRAGIGTPKSLVSKLATRFGRDAHHVALVSALSRAIGLWDASATNVSSPPGSFSLHELSSHLFTAWRRGGAWDEARPDSEILRLPPEQRDSSASSVVRELVLSALRELGDSRWIPWPSLEGYLASDHRIEGIARLLRRWAERVSAPDPDPMIVARRIVLESLPALGVIDLGEDDPEDASEDPSPRVALRLTPRGRMFLADKPAAPNAEPSKFLDTHVLRLGSSAKTGAVLALYGFVDLGRVAEALDLIVAPQTLARALSAGYEADSLRVRIETIAPLPETLSRTLQQASVVVGRGTFAAAAGFLWVEDANVRELLRTRRATADLFVDPSPPGGLLVGAQVDMDRLARRCRSVGVELVVDGQIVRARQGAPPAVSGERRRSSSTRMPKIKVGG